MKIHPNVFFACTYDIHRLQRVMDLAKSIPTWSSEKKQEINLECGLRSVFLYRLSHDPGFHQYVLDQVSKDEEIIKKTTKYLLQLKADWVDSYDSYYLSDAPAPNHNFSEAVLTHISYRNYENEYDYSLPGYIPFNPHLNASSLSANINIEVNRAMAYLKTREQSWKDRDLIVFFSLSNAEDRDNITQLKNDWQTYLHKNIERPWIYELDDYHSHSEDVISTDNSARNHIPDIKTTCNYYNFNWLEYMPSLKGIRDSAAKQFDREIPAENWINNSFMRRHANFQSEQDKTVCLYYLRFTTAFLTIAAEFWFQKHADKTAVINKKARLSLDPSVLDERPLDYVKYLLFNSWQIYYPNERKDLYVYALKRMPNDDSDRYYVLRRLCDLSELLHEEKEAEECHLQLHDFLEKHLNDEKYWEDARDHGSLLAPDYAITEFLTKLYLAESKNDFEALLLEIEVMRECTQVQQFSNASEICLRSLFYVVSKKGYTDTIEKTKVIILKKKEAVRHRIYEDLQLKSYFSPSRIRHYNITNQCEIFVEFLQTLYVDLEYMDEQIIASIQYSLILGYFHLQKFSDVCRTYNELNVNSRFGWAELAPAVYFSYLACGEKDKGQAYLMEYLNNLLQYYKFGGIPYQEIQILLEELAFASCENAKNEQTNAFIEIMNILGKDIKIDISYLFAEYCILTGYIDQGLAWFDCLIPKTQGIHKAELWLRKGLLLSAKGSMGPAMKSFLCAKEILDINNGGYPIKNHSELYLGMAKIHQGQMNLSEARDCLKTAFRYTYDGLFQKSRYAKHELTLMSINPDQRNIIAHPAIKLAELETYLENHVNTEVINNCDNARKSIESAEYESLHLYQNITDEDFDFSGPIMKYTKGLEDMLQEKVWSQVVAKVYEQYPSNHASINKEDLGWWLSSTLGPEHLSLSLGSWARLKNTISEYQNDPEEKPENKVLHLAISHLVKILPNRKTNIIINVCSEITQLRNDIAHGRVLNRYEFLTEREKLVSSLNRVIFTLWGGDAPKEMSIDERKAECQSQKQLANICDVYGKRSDLALECLKRAYKLNPTDRGVHFSVEILYDDIIRMNQDNSNLIEVYHREKDDFKNKSGPVVMGLYTEGLRSLSKEDYFRARSIFRKIDDYLKDNPEINAKFNEFVPEFIPTREDCKNQIKDANREIAPLKKSLYKEDQKKLGIYYYYVGNYSDSLKILNQVLSKYGDDAETIKSRDKALQANSRRLHELETK